MRAFRSNQWSACAPRNPSQIIVYPEAQHGFNADYRPSYKADDAQDAWKKLLAWFKKYGV